MKVDGACHCGTVRFTATLSDGLATARRCTCSFCAMRGAVAVSAPLDGFEIRAGEENLTLYTFNTHSAQHWFCRTCGIYTHHRRRSDPEEYGVNLACLDGRTPFLPEVPVTDGRRHPTDGHPPRRAGTLRYVPEDAP